MTALNGQTSFAVIKELRFDSPGKVTIVATKPLEAHARASIEAVADLVSRHNAAATGDFELLWDAPIVADYEIDATRPDHD